jgi:hypothetical protein
MYAVVFGVYSSLSLVQTCNAVVSGSALIGSMIPF